MTTATQSEPLTQRQTAVLNYIRGYIQAHGYGPSVRDIGVAMGISSPNGVMTHLRALKKKGVLRQARSGGRGVGRAFEVIGDTARELANQAPELLDLCELVLARTSVDLQGGDYDATATIGEDVYKRLKTAVRKVRAGK